MSGVLIIKPELFGAVPAVSGGTGASNLLTPSPKEVWVAPNTNAHVIDIDMGVPVTIDSFFVGYTNATADAIWLIQLATGISAPTTTLMPWTAMRPADSLGPRHHAFKRLAAPVTSRYFRIAVDQGGTVPLYIGALVLGLAFEKYRERGPDRTLIDTGNREDLPDGGFNMGDGVVKAQFSFSFVDLTDAERNRLYAIKVDRGLRKPVLVVEDAGLTAGQNEAIRYGVFERFQAYERVNPKLSRWAGSVVDWL